LKIIVSHGSSPGVSLFVRVFNYPCETQACVPDRHELASATGVGTLAANDALRFPLAYRGRTLSSLWVSPGWGNDRRG
jgi:hypothetical protein